jgi:hypothetical protein
MTDPRVTSPADDSASVGREKVQGSPGVLKPTKAPVETIEEIPVQEIKPFRGIPDYREPTTSAYPAVVKAYDQYLCIDGFELVEKATSGGMAKIRCRVFHLNQPSAIETALLKAANRMMPAGGTCLYSEIVRNARRLCEMLMESPEPPAIFNHGGARRGPVYTDNKEDNIRVLLANRLGKSTTAINQYLCHGEYLYDETLAALIEKSMGKDFFEKAQVQKRILVKNLKSAGRPEREVIEAVSSRMVSWATDYQERRSLAAVGTVERPEVAAPANAPSVNTVRTVSPIQPFDHWQGRPDIQPPPTEETIRHELRALRDAIDQALRGGTTDLLDQTERLIPEGISRFSRVQQLIVDLRQAAADGQEG